MLQWERVTYKDLPVLTKFVFIQHDFSSDNSRIFDTKLSKRIEREIHKSTKLVPTHTLTDQLVMKICRRVANQSRKIG